MSMVGTFHRGELLALIVLVAMAVLAAFIDLRHGASSRVVVGWGCRGLGLAACKFGDNPSEGD